MRPGPPRGETATLEVAVTADMASRVPGLPPVYAFHALVQHMEQVCRQVLVPHLEPGEEAVGHHVDVTHRAPVPVGATLSLTATVAQVGSQKLVCEVMVRHGGAIVARGSFEHEVVSVEAWRGQVQAQTA